MAKRGKVSKGDMLKPGAIYLVGAGPGDPGLITIKGLTAIKEADCIIYDFLANTRLLSHAREGASTIYVGKKGSTNTITQEEINALIIENALAGKTVVRLKGGDPFIFGRGGEEAEAIVNAGLTFEVIPGVTSAIAAPAYAGIPLTHREFASAVTFITGQEDPLKERPNVAWERLTVGRGTLVFLMGWKSLGLIVEKLRSNGWPGKTPVALIRWGTLTKQVCVEGTLVDIEERAERMKIKPPIVTVVGEVVGLRQKLNWFESRPLFGKTVLVTRALDQAGTFADQLERTGAETIVMPLIKTVKPPSYAEIDRAIKKLSTYDWAVFTSVNGVKYFFERLSALGLDARELKGVKLCVVGPRTAQAIEELGLKIDLIPKEFKAEGVLTALGTKNIKGKRFLMPRALDARELLPIEIKRLGGKIDVCPVYKTISPKKEATEAIEKLREGSIDVVTFTSSSTVTNFLKMFGKAAGVKILNSLIVACIGPIAAKTATDAGIKVAIVPGDYTIPALIEAIEGYYRKA